MPLDLDRLSDFASGSFDDYLAARQIPGLIDPVTGYFQELVRQSGPDGDSNSDTHSYASRNAGLSAAKGDVFDDDEIEILSFFLEHRGDKQGSDLSVGSDEWLRLRFDLMKRDIDARLDDADQGGDGNLNVDGLLRVIEGAYQDDNGLDPTTDPQYNPLWEIANNNSPEQQQSKLDEFNSGTGILDLIYDLFDTGVPITDINPNEPFHERLREHSDRFEWMGDMAQALNDFLGRAADNGVPAEDVTAMQTIIDLISDTFFAPPASHFNGVADLAEGLSNIVDVIDWFGENPEQIPEAFTPDWLEGAVDWIFDSGDTSTPLVLDLNGNGIELAALNGPGSVYWDGDVDGFAEGSGWVAGGDGLLTIDVNDDGVINDHSELFGDQTGYANGFLALASYDTNVDGLVTSADTQFGDLLVWVDANADGHSQADELHTLDTLGITEIDLGYSDVNYQISGNDILQESTFTINGETRSIVDAWFATDNVNSRYAQDYTLDVRTLFLPTLRGYGNIADLHIAMSQDETLLTMVQELATSDAATIFSATFDLKSKVEDILYRWAGVDGVDPTSRGNHVDARQLEFMEELSNSEWSSYISTPNPFENSSKVLNNVFDDLFSNFATQLLLQTDAKVVFGEDASVNAIAGTTDGVDVSHFWFSSDEYYFNNQDFTVSVLENGQNVNKDVVVNKDDLYIFHPGDGDDSIMENGGTDRILFGSSIAQDDVRLWKDGYWLNIFVGSEKIEVRNHFYDQESQVEYAVFSDGSVIDLVNNLTFTGTSAHDTMLGSEGHDTFYGDGGINHLTGLGGADVFAFEAANAFDSADTIHDFSLAEGDAIDVTDVLSGFYDPASDDITDFVRITGDAHGLLQIDQDGGADNFVTIAQINNNSGLTDEQSLLDNGHLLFRESGNTAPTAVNESFIADEDQIITGNVLSDNGNGADSDVDAHAVYAQAKTYTSEQGGTVVMAANGDFTYTPAADYYGEDRFDYILLDGHGGRTVGTVTLTLNPINDGPVAANDDVFGPQDQPIFGNLFADNGNGADSDVENDTLNVQAGTFATALGGSITISANGDFTYSPTNGFTGDDSFAYTLLDGQGGSDTATLNLTVTSVTYNYVTGTAVTNFLHGGGDFDVIDGQEGNDYIYGYAGDDTYLYDLNDGYDYLYDSAGLNDKIEFGAGITQDDIRLWNQNNGDLRVYVGSQYITINDQFDGTGEEIETALFADGSMLDLVNNLNFTGTASTEFVHGRGDDNTLTGGTGNDYLYGYGGNDTYLYNSGDGYDYIYDSAGTDILEFGVGITQDDIRLWNPNNGDLRVYVGSEYITINDHFDGTNEEVETALFADSSTLDLLNNLTIEGTATGEFVRGFDDDNVLIGGTGNDYLYGYEGNDTYLYNSGDGYDYIYDSAGTDVLEFGLGITASDVRLWNQNTGDLRLYLGSDYITINDHFDGTGEEIETALFADGSVLDLVNNLTFKGTATNDYMYGLGDDDILYGEAGNDYLYARAGDDVIFGGQGSDYLYGEAGSDIFVIEGAYYNTGQDNLMDFNVSDDRLDISDVLDLSDWDGTTAALNDYVSVTDQSGYTYVGVDLDGAGSAHSTVDVARLSGVSGTWTSASDMAGNDLDDNTGNLIV